MKSAEKLLKTRLKCISLILICKFQTKSSTGVIITPENRLKCIPRIPSSPKIAPNIANRKRQIKSRIVGKKRQNSLTEHDSPTPLSSPPAKRVKPTSPESPEIPVPVSVPKKVERVFHHSGAKKYSVQDGPVSLIAYENRHARGGYSVRVLQSGEFVGLIASGEEVACRRLL